MAQAMTYSFPRHESRHLGRGSRAPAPAGGGKNNESMLVLPFLDSSRIEDDGAEIFTGWAVRVEVGRRGTTTKRSRTSPGLSKCSRSDFLTSTFRRHSVISSSASRASG